MEKKEKELSELEGLMNEINPAAVPYYREQYEKSGAEQFRPNSTKYGCRLLQGFETVVN
jgi:hypothetical protein